ncbi:uncharacterized protein LOC133985181 isoform X2 [Scomber scombrus]|uniref:uncharacterized protein LOC133985181 isoform X2 n=1 Tax=Scomber scombrus TaxID=13677 RepID=UPI002DD86B67|nr:uncharacterized protein LOC133985181 isoform X2 [Scomber scombrus]
MVTRGRPSKSKMVALCITRVTVVVISCLLHVLSSWTWTQRRHDVTLRHVLFHFLALKELYTLVSIPPTTSKAANPKMLSCHCATDPIIRVVDVLYDYNNDDDNLWMSNGSLPFCSSTSPPSASSCVVCVRQGVYAVCGHLMQAVKLVMEASGRQIEIIKSECPWLLGDATVQSATESPAINPDTTGQWPIIIPILLILLFLFFLLMGYCIFKRNRNTSEPKIKVEKNGDTFYLNIPDADIVKPEAEVQSGKKEAAARLNVPDANADEQESKAVN